MNLIPTVIIPILTRQDLLQRNLDSWQIPVNHLIIINNSGKPLDIRFPMVNKTTVINSPTNLGVAPSWNLGIKMTPHSQGWMILNNDMWFPDGAMAAFANDCHPHTLTLSNGAPKWCCFWVGEQIVERCGLFSECFVPAYFEDLDYERRVGNLGGKIVWSNVAVNHDNASTLNSDPRLGEQAIRTFKDNRDLYHARLKDGWRQAGEWSLERRRRLGWEL